MGHIDKERESAGWNSQNPQLQAVQKKFPLKIIYNWTNLCIFSLLDDRLSLFFAQESSFDFYALHIIVILMEQGEYAQILVQL